MHLFKKSLLIIGCLIVLVAAGIVATIHYLTNPKRDIPMVYSNNALLQELWNDYKVHNIEAGSYRTLDKSQNNITTSEGESYTMLRAVWMDDKTTFDQSWTFTQDNLQRADDHLMSWKFGKRTDGGYGILTDSGGQNTASDADTDIALSLLMAYSRWNQPSYLYQARQIISSIWAKEVVLIQGKPVLAADDIERNSATSIVVNPSYFAPYSYRLFAQADPAHNWSALVDNSYALLGKLSSSKLDKNTSIDLPPNWITINRRTGTFISASSSNLDTNYGYDAFRIPWRLALDYQWNKDPRDKQLLQSFSFLGKQWQTHGSLKAIYAHDGTVVGNYEVPAAYGASMGYFTVINPQQAGKVYQQKLETLYSPDRQQWKTPLAYYDDNWAWFGMALAQDSLPNLVTNNH